MKRNTALSVLVAIILVGFFLRLYHLDTVAFRGDEAFSVQRWSATPLYESLTDIASIEPHPPLTYILFRAWGLIFGTYFGFSLRMLPLLFNLMGIPALYAIGKLLSGRHDIGLLAAFFWAIHPFQIWHAQDYRNYAIWAGLSTLTVWLGLHLILAKRKRHIDWIFYTLLALSSCLIFYNELITIGVLGLFVLIFYWRDRRFLVQWSLLNGGIIAIIFLTFFIFQGDLITSGGYGGTTGGFELTQYWQRFLPVLAFGDSLSVTLMQQFNADTVWWPLVLLLIMVSWLTVLYYQPKQAYFLALLGFVPLVMLGLISMRLSIFRPRYIMIAIPAYILMLSFAINVLWQHNLWQKLISFVLVLTWLGLSLTSLNNYYNNSDYAKAPNWPALANYLEANTEESEVIIQTSVDAGFGYYYDRADILAGEFALPADVDQPISEIIATMEQTSANYHSIWIVGQTFPDWPNTGLVEKWALENLQLVRETHIARLPVRQFMAWDVLPSEIEVEPLAVYGDSIELVGTHIFEPEPTNELTIWLYWRPLILTETPQTVFVHLIGDLNPATGTPLWSQEDHPPQNDRASTSEWETNVFYRDMYKLSLENVVTGEYILMAGFYDPQNGTRLLLEDGSDAFTVGKLQIEENN
jgi:hypothetical protein